MNQPSLTSNSPEFAKQLVERMAATYTSCHSYMDEGEVTTVFIHKNNKRRTVIRPFSTAFVRPTDFRFEFRDRYQEDSEWRHYIVWQGGESVQTWWSVQPDREPQPNLMRAIAGATGVSGGSAVTVPSLLMPDTIKRSGILSLADLEATGEETLENATAHKIEGNRRPYERDGKVYQSKLTIWINTQTFLLLKTFNRRQFEDFETESTTTYRPQMNITVPPDKLAFNAPA